MSETPEASDHTSIQRRIRTVFDANEGKASQPPELMPFVGYPRQNMPKGLAFRLEDYLSLVDWTSRQIKENKRGTISCALPPMLQRLGIEPGSWYSLTEGFEKYFNTFVGKPDGIQEACESRGQSWAHGIGAARRLFGT
jgi:hypothetical protein